jgi:hypothetical protein
MNVVSAGETSRNVWTAAAALVLVLGLAAPVAAQQAQASRISLADALRLAEDASESVAVARAGVMRSDGDL